MKIFLQSIRDYLDEDSVLENAILFYYLTIAF